MNNIIFTLCTTEYTDLGLDTPAREIGKWADMSDWVHKFPDIELHEWVDQGTTDREPSRRPYLPRQFFSARQHRRKRVVRQLAGSSSTARTCGHWRIELDMRFSFRSRKAFRECDFRGWLEKKRKKQNLAQIRKIVDHQSLPFKSRPFPWLSILAESQM